MRCLIEIRSHETRVAPTEVIEEHEEYVGLTIGSVERLSEGEPLQEG
jgi:hypothetical protein